MAASIGKPATGGHGGTRATRGTSTTVTTPLTSETQTVATRSPWLTVVLAVLILAVLTAAALAALHWWQKRASRTLFTNEPVHELQVSAASLYNGRTVDSGSQEADYEAVLL